MKILVIDDSEVIRNLLNDFLQDLEFKVEFAIDGSIGIDMALNNEYDIIICDTHMPKKNGYQVYKEVSAKKPGVRFIMTNSLPDNLAKKTCEEGAFCILDKPFDLHEVKSALDKVLMKSKQYE